MAAKITQSTLTKILKTRAQIETLQKALKVEEEKLVERLKAGAPITPGVLTARMSEWERRSVAWRQVCARELGEEFCQRVFNATKPDKHESLVVETIA